MDEQDSDIISDLSAVIVAGGSGKRMNSSVKKQYLKLKGEFIFIITLLKIKKIVNDIVLVISNDDEQFVKSILKERGLDNITVAFGGRRRQDSVYNGLLKAKNEKVVVHDVVRPFFSEELIFKGYEALEEYNAVITGSLVKNTIKVQKNSIVSFTLDRSELVSVQTPQFFNREKLVNYYNEYYDVDVTDDASFFELKKEKIFVILGSDMNIKLTTPFDLAVAEVLLKKGLVNV